MNIKIYHNPRCSKSRNALKLIEEKKLNCEVIKYLEVPPTINELKNILKTLNIKPIELIRKNESVFKKNFKNKKFSDEEWIKIMSQNPILIERPIIIANEKAIIGRPPEKIFEII